MKRKAFNLGLLLTSLIGYLEWGGNNSIFLFQAEADILSRLFTEPGSVAHPFTLLPMAGQLLLVVTLFLKEPTKVLTFVGIVCIGLLLGFMFLIGLLTISVKVLLSSLPFLVLSYFTIRLYRNTGN
ncbi:MAG: hypothetical protein ABL895_10375 [Cyclobacteriaceae bacterium]